MCLIKVIPNICSDRFEKIIFKMFDVEKVDKGHGREKRNLSVRSHTSKYVLQNV